VKGPSGSGTIIPYTINRTRHESEQKMAKHVYFFGEGKAEGDSKMRDLLGGKGADLAEMTNLGINVPPGFTITTEVCTHFMERGGGYPDGLAEEVRANLAKVEKVMGAVFGDPRNPLLVSVRSGARKSMPGMMDTVLNLGLNDTTVEALAAKTKNPRFAYDSYRRFIHMYSNVVLDIEHRHFQELIDKKKAALGAKTDQDLTVEDLKALIAEYKAIVRESTGEAFPDDAGKQLWGAIAAVFRSWNGDRAVAYRKLEGIPHHWGTAVNVQAMVFGNMGPNSATGVAFTRDPATGERRFFGEFLPNAQGEDVVAGIRTPLPVNVEKGNELSSQSLEATMPAIYKELESIYQKLEKHFRDMQDIEFTIQEGRLWMLQTRSGKRTGRAAIRIAVDMVDEGMIDEKTALKRVDPMQLDSLLHPTIDPKVKAKPIAKGLPASPGAGTGKIVFSVEEAVERVSAGEKVVLVRLETSPEDVEGMHAAEAIVTARGGMTSHAAVVARGMGKCCVVGCSALHVDHANRALKVGGKTYRSGDPVTVDGSAGHVYEGSLPMVKPVLDEYFHRFMKWADAHRRLKVRANADTPEDAETAIKFGAEGIGLARTEHMFFKEDRIPVVREMILAATREERIAALKKILPMQRSDFVGVFRAMTGKPVTIRLLDPPLHEFLPKDEAEIKSTAEVLRRSPDEIRAASTALHEFNPMLGHRGCRLGITYPEIYEVQVEAILEAAVIAKREGVDVRPEIMVPLVGIKEELVQLREMIKRIGDGILEREKEKIPYLIGTMIEVPRAAVVADQIAETAEFFSFGTNDLTQMTFGFSRDDSGKFLNAYVTKGVIPKDPFQSLDRDGVGGLVQMAVSKGRATNPKIKLGVCGEHGGDPASIEFFHRAGLDYVSCSPYRVPVARLAAARAALE
jgi:pyruvate,orthophosphate dikinase